MKARTVLAACTILCGLVAALVVPAVVHANAGHQDGAYTAGTNGSPTTSKPESKVWFSHKRWWAVMAKKAATGGNTYFIFQFKTRRQRWVSTRVAVDTRDSTRQDVLSVGNKLFIASHKYVSVSRDTVPGINDEMRLYRFSYKTGIHKYVLDSGFPTTIDPEKSETLVIDRELTTGVLWATWVQADATGHHVYVKSTTGNCVSGPSSNCTWGGAGVLDDVAADDISSIVSFGGNKVGVMWSNTTDVNNDRILFAVHQDGGTWSSSETAVHGRKMADDHINLKADSSGRVYAATKTKFTGPANPGTMLLRRTTGGTWRHWTISRGSLGHTRPIVLIDQRHNRIRVFEGSTDNTAIFMKTSRLNHPSFPVLRRGARVIQDRGSKMGNATSTKQRLSMSHFVVLATNPATKRYWHAYLRTRP
jgi:hypothetical protein